MSWTLKNKSNNYLSLDINQSRQSSENYFQTYILFCKLLFKVIPQIGFSKNQIKARALILDGNS